MDATSLYVVFLYTAKIEHSIEAEDVHNTSSQLESDSGID